MPSRRNLKTKSKNKQPPRKATSKVKLRSRVCVKEKIPKATTKNKPISALKASRNSLTGKVVSRAKSTPRKSTQEVINKEARISEKESIFCEKCSGSFLSNMLYKKHLAGCKEKEVPLMKEIKLGRKRKNPETLCHDNGDPIPSTSSKRVKKSQINESSDHMKKISEGRKADPQISEQESLNLLPKTSNSIACQTVQNPTEILSDKVSISATNLRKNIATSMKKGGIINASKFRNNLASSMRKAQSTGISVPSSHTRRMGRTTIHKTEDLSVDSGLVTTKLGVRKSQIPEVDLIEKIVPAEEPHASKKKSNKICCSKKCSKKLNAAANVEGEKSLHQKIQAPVPAAAEASCMSSAVDLSMNTNNRIAQSSNGYADNEVLHVMGSLSSNDPLKKLANRSQITVLAVKSKPKLVSTIQTDNSSVLISTMNKVPEDAQSLANVSKGPDIHRKGRNVSKLTVDEIPGKSNAVSVIQETPSTLLTTNSNIQPEQCETVLPDPTPPLNRDAEEVTNPNRPLVKEEKEEKVTLQDFLLSDAPSSSTANGSGDPEITFTCAECQKTFTRKYHLDRHLRLSKCSGLPMPSFPCELCNRVYTRKDNLREHLRSHTGEVHRRKNHKCTYCDKAFHGQSLLAIHVRKHTGEKPFACDFCTKRFPSTGSLAKHRMTHTGEKPYECNECKRRFTLKGTLSRHIRTHTGIRPHACSFCGKKFIQIGGLNAHMFYHTGENGFKCDECGKVFNRKARLQMHKLYIHIKIKPFTCQHCSKAFTRKEDLLRHSVLHTGEKPYQCPTCDRRFSVKPSLKLHLLTHTKEEPRSCHECGRAFIRKDCLLRHMRKRHRDVFDKLLFDEKDEKDSSLVNTRVLSEKDLTDNIRELLYLLIDEPTLVGFGWPEKPVDKVLESVIQRCGHTPVSKEDYNYMDCLRENTKLLFTVVIDDNAVKTLLNNQTVDEVILHVLRLAKT